MSMALQSLLGGMSSTGKVASGGKASTGSEAGLLSFNTAFTSLMAGENVEINSVLNDNPSLLEGLMSIASRVGNSDSAEQEGLADQLIELLSMNGEEIDQALEQDPALMLMLQGWLLQVSAVLNGNDLAQQGEGEHALSNLTPLANDPTTMRFALLDTLAQISSSDQLQWKGEPGSQSNKLMLAFQFILQDAGVNMSAKGMTSQIREGSSNQQPLAFFNSQPAEANTVAGGTSLAQGNNLTENSLFKVISGNTTDSNLTDQPSDDQGNTIFMPGTVTAGQLALRDSLQGSVRTGTMPVPVEQFADEMNQFVVQKFDVIKMQGVTEAKITLYPENLGQVDIKITMQNGQLVAQFMTEHASARDLIDQQMGHLRAALQSQGIQVEKLEVTQNPSLQSHMYQDGRQPNSGQQQSGSQSKDREEHSDDALHVAELTEEWNEWIDQQEEEVNGSSFTAQA